jgi:hypothetical protein
MARHALRPKLRHWLRDIISSGADYRSTVIGTTPIAFWPLDDSSGVVTDYSGNARHGVGYTGVTLSDATGPDGYPCPRFVTTTRSQADVYSASFVTAFDGQEGSLMTWNKVASADDWTDATSNYWLSFLVDADNRCQLAGSGGEANRFGWTYTAGGIDKVEHVFNIDFTKWFNVVMTWSLSNDRTRIYINGNSIGEQTGLGTFVGTLISSRCIIGDFAGDDAWNGWMANIAVWNRELAASEVSSLANVPGLVLDGTGSLTSS